MSLITPILTVTCCAFAVPHINAAENAAKLIRRFIPTLPLIVPTGSSIHTPRYSCSFSKFASSSEFVKFSATRPCSIT